ncbi:MAG: hypothetical protein ABFS10_05895 [Bacteroidota bacterium]
MAVLYMLLTLAALLGGCGPDPDPEPEPDPVEMDFEFNGSISEEVLRSYLSRAITQAEFCTGTRFYYDGPVYVREDDERMLLNIGAKFMGRAAFMWGDETRSNDPGFFGDIAVHIDTMHAQDPDMIFQAAIFEIITEKINQIEVPSWVFEAFDEPVESRNFNFSAVVNPNGWGANAWGANTCIPDVSLKETQRYFYYLARNYIDAGIEAIHWGQMMAMTDYSDKNNNYAGLSYLLEKVREYASGHARRGLVLCDAHISQGIKAGDKLLFDFNSFPLRLREKIGSPTMEAEIVKYHMDAIYGRSLGGITPGGWSCDALPYIVEFDNYGISDNPGEPDIRSHFVWGYDEISWFALQEEEARNQFLEYAFARVRELDPAGYLQMPGNRVMSKSFGTRERYRANTKGTEFPFGYSQEETIKRLWGGTDDE